MSPSKPHICTFDGCNARFPRPHKLQQHMQKHLGNETPYKCDEPNCNKAYGTPSHLQRHKKTFHEKVAKPIDRIKCPYPYCPIEFVNSSNLKRHIKGKHGLGYKCSECQQTFPKKSQLNKHSFLHTGEPFFKCDLCGKAFIEGRRLNRHKKKHKIYKCEDCPKEFDKWSLLRKHMTEHVYQCTECEYQCNSKKLLKGHKSFHLPSDERKPIKCTYEGCTRSYMHQRNLNYHVKSFHLKEKKKYPCPVENCECSFSKKIILEKHMKQHNGVTEAKRRKQRKARSDKGVHKVDIVQVLVNSGLVNAPVKVYDGSEIKELDENIVPLELNDPLAAEDEKPKSNELLELIKNATIKIVGSSSDFTLPKAENCLVALNEKSVVEKPTVTI